MSKVPYSYRAADTAGGFHTGTLLAESRAEVLDSLARSALIAISVDPGTGAIPSRGDLRIRTVAAWRKRQTRITSKHLADLTETMASLLTAGLTIDRALQFIAGYSPRANLRIFAKGLLAEVRGGRTLFSAFSVCDQPLPGYYVSMVEAGEVGGSLPQALSNLAALLAKQLEFRERIRSALIYPSLLATVVLFTLIILLAFVLPRFESLFADSREKLPWATQVVLAVGRFVADYWWLITSALAVSTLGALAWIRSPAGCVIRDRWAVRTKLLLGLPVAFDTARCLQTLSALCAGGQTLTAALKTARGSLINGYLRSALSEVIVGVQQGQALSTALSRQQCFPLLAVQLARVGEETGSLPAMLSSAATVLERDARRVLERLLAVAVPLVTIFMGAIVAGLIGSVLIGLLSINDLAI